MVIKNKENSDAIILKEKNETVVQDFLTYLRRLC